MAEAYKRNLNGREGRIVFAATEYEGCYLIRFDKIPGAIESREILMAEGDLELAGD
jgi:hypothetical protein